MITPDNLPWLLAAAAIGITIAAVLFFSHRHRKPIPLRGVVISDTSVITNLAAVNLLHLLAELYGGPDGTVYVPPRVYREMRRKARRNHAWRTIRQTRWLVRAPVRESARVRALLRQYHRLDRGEAEAIILATEISASLLLIDEALGRRVALSLGIEVRGLVGIVSIARKAGKIGPIKPILDTLRAEPIQFRLAQSLYEQILRDVGEL